MFTSTTQNYIRMVSIQSLNILNVVDLCPGPKFCDIIVNMDDSKALRDEAQIPREHLSPSRTVNSLAPCL